MFQDPRALQMISISLTQGHFKRGRSLAPNVFVISLRA